LRVSALVGVGVGLVQHLARFDVDHDGRVARLGAAARQQQDQRNDWKQGDFQEPKSTIHR
jgi:hypothetical protein